MLRKTKLSIKFFLLLLSMLVFLGFFTKILLTKYAKKFVLSNHFDEYILSHYSPDIRYDQFYLLDKSKNKIDSYLFCTSACLVMNPNLLKNNLYGFNLSIGAGQVTDFLKYFKWILKNKNKPRKIFIGLEFYSLSDQKFVKFFPHEVESNIFLKIRSLYIDTSIKKFLFSKYILNKNTSLNQSRKDKLKFASNGQRLFESFYVRKQNPKLHKKHLERLNGRKIHDFEDNIDEKKIKKLNELMNLAKKNNIEVSVFFIPIHEKKLKWKNGKIFNEEINLIKEIFKRTPVNELTYFNNFNKVNKNIIYYEQDMNHINYDAAKFIEHDLKNKNKKTGMVFSRNTLKNDLLFLRNLYDRN